MRMISDLAQTAYPPSGEDAPPEDEETVYRIAVRDLNSAWSIGVHDRERARMQPIRINLDLEARAPDDWEADDYGAVPCYAGLAERIRAMVAEGHVKLIETLASRIADLCLEDDRVISATVRVEKPKALANAASVGVEITRSRGARFANPGRPTRSATPQRPIRQSPESPETSGP